MAESRVTKAGAYVEISADEIHVTLAGLYLEIDIPCPPEGVKPSETNTTVIYAGIDITQYCTRADLEALVNQVDATTLASEFIETAPGGVNWSVNLAGLLAKEIDDILGKDVLSPPGILRSLVVTVGGSTRCGTTYSWSNNSAVGAFVDDYKIGPNDPLKEGTTWTAVLGVSGGPSISVGKTIAIGRTYS